MKLKKGVILQKLGDSFVAYDNKTSTMHELNEEGYLILSGIEKGKTRPQIIKSIISNFAVESREAEKDLEEFLQVLEKKQLL